MLLRFNQSAATPRCRKPLNRWHLRGFRHLPQWLEYWYRPSRASPKRARKRLATMAQETTSNESEVKRNYEAFRQKLPELLQTHRGKFALMHAAEIAEFFDTAGDAYKVGTKNYGAGNFSIQEVTDSSVDLGFFTHAVPERSL
jgi:hypothetical protein